MTAGEEARRRSADAAAGLFGAGLKDEARALLNEQRQTAPGDRHLLAAAAAMARAEGDLDGCVTLLQRLAELGQASPTERYLLAVLRGEVSQSPPAPGAAWPVPFVRRAGFLEPQRIAQLLALFTANAEAFIAARINRDDERVVSGDVRSAKIFYAPDSLRAWFLPLLEAAVARALPLLYVAPFAVAKIDLQCTASHGGDFYKEHRDATPQERGDIRDRRVSFVYYLQPRSDSFAGGDLKLYDSDRLGAKSDLMTYTRLPPEPNSLVLFPSAHLHEVMPVRCAGADFLAGRLTVNGWIYEKPAPVQQAG